MKTLFFSLLLIGKLLAAPHMLELKFIEGEETDYSAQIQEAFTKLLASDEALAKEFAGFEAAPPEDERGRYSGEPVVQHIIIGEEESADFKDTGGTKDFTKTVALYYRFDEGFHRGQGTRNGFFAVFAITGKLTFANRGDDDFQLSGAKVTAEFQDFSRTLTAPGSSE
jgi:hypothetical protein